MHGNTSSADGKGGTASGLPMAQPAYASPAQPSPKYPYKYEEQLAEHKPCPPRSLTCFAGTAFRFNGEQIDGSAFLPQAISNAQILAGKEKSHCCSLFALSMYESLEKLRNKAQIALETQPNMLKRLGTFFVEIEIKDCDGERTKANTFGHFDFFERSCFEATSAIKAHAKLLP